MDLSQDDVLWILKLLETSDVDYLELELEGIKLIASRSGRLPARETMAAGTAPSQAPAPSPVNAQQIPADPTTPGGDHASGEALEDMDGLVTVKAPIVGVFYVAPDPGAPPYVEVGTHVEEGTTMGLVEVMKMFNSVSAEVGGIVVRRLVDNGNFVEFGQPLFLIRKDVLA